jgi:hypothetical protein
LYNKNKTKLVLYPAGKTEVSFTIPNTVTGIGSYAFYYYCISITSITIPASVTSIESYGFYYCTNLVSVTFEGTINSNNFDSYAVKAIGDLRDKFYATDPTNGTPGTYTTAEQKNYGSVWEKQP